MSASRVGRNTLKAKVPVTGPTLRGTVGGSKVNTRTATRKHTKPHISTPTSTPPPTLPKRANQHLLNLNPQPDTQNRMSPRAMTVLGVSVLAISTYSGYLYASYCREVAQSQSLDVPRDVSDRYNHTAQSFDADVELSEKLMRMGKKRRELVRRARGDVLEVSCGTGRNLEYYDLGERRSVDDQGRADIRGCRSATFIDLSPQMVKIARDKFTKLYPGFRAVVFRAQDAMEVPPPCPPPVTPSYDSQAQAQPAYYDTVVQTMGLCSMPDPVSTLRHLGTITEPQHGRLLLLEHGRSYYDWLNRVLDNLAPAHADRHGCWWNRDIGQIVRESGLEIVEEERWHFGTTWKYVLRPARSSG